MTAGEQGFLLLTGYLGDPERRPLTVSQFRNLALRVRSMDKPEIDRHLTEDDLIALGYDRAFAQHVVILLSHQEQMQRYLKKGEALDCIPVTRLSADYPQRLRKVMGLNAPGVLWLKGDANILRTPMVALVGSRDLKEENLAFAREAGKQAALQGYTLVSGHARGADRAAQDACLEHGGKVISVVADQLDKQPLQKNVLYLSEEGFDLGFSSHRALQRNLVIHSLGNKTFVAQCTLGKGGTWDGTRKNLQLGLSSVFCYDDGSAASKELECFGAKLISFDALNNISQLQQDAMNFIDQ